VDYARGQISRIYKMNIPNITLVTGAARSGKSEWAERLAVKSGLQVVYVATAKIDPTDAEWQVRIGQHRQRRPLDWQIIEGAENLTEIITVARPGQCLLIDSLGTWVANFLEDAEEVWLIEQSKFLDSLKSPSSMVILVAEETGWGVVPAYALGRLFRDRLGTLTRKIGSIADPVYLVTAGRVLNLAQLGESLDRLD
jgi:adenosylcobinamide kinase / adenosylcobinamide-phosphate guanylyltransferase